MKEDNLEPVIINEEKALAKKVEDKDEWVIDSGCSHHMIVVVKSNLVITRHA